MDQVERTRFQADVRRSGPHEAHVRLSGEFDLTSAAALRALFSGLALRYERLELSLADVSFIDLVAMRSLVEAMAFCSGCGCAMRVTGVRPATARVFELSAALGLQKAAA